MKYLFGIEEAGGGEKEEDVGWFKAIKKKIKDKEANRILQRIDAVTKIYSRDFNLKIKPYKGNLWAISYETDPPTVLFPEKDLSTKSADEIVGSAIHEGVHRDITWGVPGVFAKKESTRLLLNGIEDPRVNNWAMEKMAGSRKYMDVMYKNNFPEFPEEKFQDDKVLPHVQYVLGIIHYWFYGKEHPAIKNKDVLDALTKTRKEVEEIYNIHAGKVTFSLKDRDTIVVNSINYGKKMYSLPRPGQIRALGRDDIGSIERIDEDNIRLSTAKGRETMELPEIGEKVTRLVTFWPSAQDKKKAFLTVAKRIEENVLPEYDKLVVKSMDISRQGIKGGSGQRMSDDEIEEQAREKVEEQSKDFADSFGGQIVPEDDRKPDDSDDRGVSGDDENEPGEGKPGEGKPGEG
ncbi:MAG: hypothetical protein V2A64_00220, partial [Candidatus Omnitrophota bacterium]